MEQTVLSQISLDETVALAQQLIRIPSHYRIEGGETQVARHIAERLTEEGIACEIDEVFEGRSNVYAGLPGKDPEAPSLLLCGHIDTVLADGMDHDPFSGEVKDGKLWGRGAADMKGGNAAMLIAMMAIRRAGVSLRGSLHYAGVVGEESPNNSEGARRLRQRGGRYDYAVVGEATGLKIAGCHKGMSWFRVDLKGKAAHASKPEQGINAVSAAARMVIALEEDLAPVIAKRSHEHVSSPTLNIGRIEGGLQNNTVPDTCWFSLDRRTVPKERVADAKAEIERTVEAVAKAYPGLIWSVTEEPETQGRGPMSCGLDHALVHALSAGVRSVLDQAPRLGGVDYWTDGAHLADMGARTVVFGPGSIAQAHASTEFIEVRQLYDAARIYALAAVSLLG